MLLLALLLVRASAHESSLTSEMDDLLPPLLEATSDPMELAGLAEQPEEIAAIAQMYDTAM